MLTHPLENLDPAQSVHGLPRHLAGPVAVDPRAVWAFPFEEGSPFAQTETGTAAVFSPCLSLQTTFDPQPDKPGKGAWTIKARRAPRSPRQPGGSPLHAHLVRSAAAVAVMAAAGTLIWALAASAEPSTTSGSLSGPAAAYRPAPRPRPCP